VIESTQSVPRSPRGLAAAVLLAVALGACIGFLFEDERVQDGIRFFRRSTPDAGRRMGVARHAALHRTGDGWELVRGSSDSASVQYLEKWDYLYSSAAGRLAPPYDVLQPPGAAVPITWTPDDSVELSLATPAWDGTASRLLVGARRDYYSSVHHLRIEPDVVSIEVVSSRTREGRNGAAVHISVLDTDGGGDWTLREWRRRIGESLAIAADALGTAADLGPEATQWWWQEWGANVERLADFAVFLRIDSALPALRRLDQHWPVSDGLDREEVYVNVHFVRLVLEGNGESFDLELGPMRRFASRYSALPEAETARWIEANELFPRAVRDEAAAMRRYSQNTWPRRRDHRLSWTLGERAAQYGSAFLIATLFLVLGSRLDRGRRTQAAGGALAIALASWTLAGLSGAPLALWPLFGALSAVAVAVVLRIARPGVIAWPVYVMALGALCAGIAWGGGGRTTLLVRLSGACTFVSLCGLAIAADHLLPARSAQPAPAPARPARVRKRAIGVTILLAAAGAALLGLTYEPGYGVALLRQMRHAEVLVPTLSVLLLAALGVWIGGARSGAQRGERPNAHGTMFTPALLLGVCAHAAFVLLAARSASPFDQADVLSGIGIAAAVIVAWTAVTRVLSAGRVAGESVATS